MTTTRSGSPQRLRVLHLGKYLPPQPGGIERFLAELMSAQRAIGVLPAAMVHREKTWRGPDCRQQSRGLALRAPVIGNLAFTPVSPSWPCRLAQLIKRWRPDVLHLHLPNPSVFWMLMLPSARRLPWIVHWHSDVPVDALDWKLRLLYRIYRPLESAVLRRADRIIATSNAYAQSSRALAPWLDKVDVVPLGLPDLPAQPPRPDLWPSSAARRLLFVGRFSYYKGLEHLLDAMAHLPDAYRLLMIGDGEQRPRIEQKIATMGLSSRVRLAGSLDDRTLAGAYAAADLLCLPSIERSEAFGLVLLEAMRAGVACIASNVPGSGMGEVLADDAGRLVPPANAGALAKVIHQLGEDEDLRRQLAANGRSRFVGRFGIDRVAERINEVYRQVPDSR